VTEIYDPLIDDWRSWTGILNNAQAKELVKTWVTRSFNQSEETEDMAKSKYNVTVPATITAVIEATDDKEAVEKFRALAKAVFGNMFGVVSIVGDAQVVEVAKTKTKSKIKDEDKEEEEDEDEPEEEDEDGDEDEPEEEDEDEPEEEDEDEPVKKSSNKADKKPDKKSDDGKKKIKIKLRG
jgi:N-methylhydantoinase A/oxoprolinase/acetone carboxylase beta subunit